MLASTLSRKTEIKIPPAALTGDLQRLKRSDHLCIEDGWVWTPDDAQLGAVLNIIYVSHKKGAECGQEHLREKIAEMGLPDENTLKLALAELMRREILGLKDDEYYILPKKRIAAEKFIGRYLAAKRTQKTEARAAAKGPTKKEIRRAILKALGDNTLGEDRILSALGAFPRKSILEELGWLQDHEFVRGGGRSGLAINPVKRKIILKARRYTEG